MDKRAIADETSNINQDIRINSIIYVQINL